MGAIGKPERASQDRVIQLFQDELGYAYLGDWEKEVRTQPIEEGLLIEYLNLFEYVGNNLIRFP